MYQHGYIGLTFLSHTESFFSAVLKTSPRALQVGFSAPGWPAAFFITHINNPTVSANAMSSRGYLMMVLDYRADLSRGTIVPQVPWFPQTPRDLRKYVTDAVLQLPIFLRQDDGTIGMSLSDVIHGNFRRLMDSIQQVNVGGRTSVHVRINVSALLGSMFFLEMFISTFIVAWRIEPNGITRNDIILVGVVHVSSGSWMPIIQLNRRLY